jgi:hypothetical protein
MGMVVAIERFHAPLHTQGPLLFLASIYFWRHGPLHAYLEK